MMTEEEISLKVEDTKVKSEMEVSYDYTRISNRQGL